jgi:hypothetical protein
MQDVKKPNSTTTENQSAVDFLINQWLYLDTEFEMGLMDKNTYWQKLREIQAKSKEMFEKQIINAYYVNCDVNTIQTGEQYYNETFKSK